MDIFSLLSESPIAAVVFLLSVVLAVTVHEFAHAWTADRLGDDTPALQGRVSLSPAAHLDPLGSFAFLLLGFGWGKPVLYNPMRLSRRVDELLIALAGPASNLLLAFFLHLLITALGSAMPVYQDFLQLAAQINILLAAFNLIPIPPLDGSSIIAYFWPDYRSLVGGQIGIVLLLLLIFVQIPGQGSLLSTVVEYPLALFYQLTTLFGLLG